MNKREVSKMLKSGLGYVHIAESLGVPEREVSAFVQANLKGQTRTRGRIPMVTADEAFMKRFTQFGATRLAKDLDVSVAAIYRAKRRYEAS